MSLGDLPARAMLRPKDTWSVTLSFAALAILFYVGTAVYNAYFGPLARFPGPIIRKFSKLPIVRTLMTGTDNIVIPELHARYGPVVRVGPNELSFTGGIQAWQDIYGAKKYGQPKPYKDLLFYDRPLNQVDGILTADDETHSRQRKVMSPAFSEKALKDQELMLKQWARKMRDKLVERSESGEETDMLKYYNCTTFDIMGDLAFSEGLNMLEESEYSPWVKLIFAGLKIATIFRGFRTINNLTNRFVREVLFKLKAIQQKQQEHWDYSTQRVERRLKRTPERPDLWSKIMEKSEGPDALTIDEHHSNASLVMIAGTETTATALSGTTYHLLRNPDTMAQLTSEVRNAFPSFEHLNFEGLARQKYLMAVLQEGLRMYPPVPCVLPRITPKGGMSICGEWIPEDTTVGVHQLATYRMESYFKHANEFHPERWLGDPRFKDDHRGAFKPFSVGPRNCIGENLAWHEMRLLLATVMLHFDLKLADQSKDWSNQKVYTLWEKKPLMCTLKSTKV